VGRVGGIGLGRVRFWAILLPLLPW